MSAYVNHLWALNGAVYESSVFRFRGGFVTPQTMLAKERKRAAWSLASGIALAALAFAGWHLQAYWEAGKLPSLIAACKVTPASEKDSGVPDFVPERSLDKSSFDPSICDPGRINSL